MLLLVVGMLENLLSIEGPMKSYASLIWLGVSLLIVMPGPNLHAARLTLDFSPDANPSQSWQFGYKSQPDGPFNLYQARYYGAADENTQAYWGWISNSESWIRQNLGPNEFYWPGQGTFPVHSVSLAPGYPGLEDHYAVVRYVIPSAGRYRVAIWTEATGISDLDVHFRTGDREWAGRNLNPGERLGLTNEQFYAEGSTIEIAAGRGADGSNYGAVLQTDAQIDLIGDLAIPFSDGLAENFPGDSLPSDGWTLGYKSAWDGPFQAYTEHFFGDAFGDLQAYWGRVANTESFIRRNESSHFITVEDQGTFPPHGLSAAPGPSAAPDSYAVARYQIPSNGVYRIEMIGYSSGASDVDVHLTQDGVELVGRNLVSPQEIHLQQERYLFAGTVLEVAVGRGADDSNYGAIFQFDARIKPLTDSVPEVPEIAFVPSRRSFIGELTVQLGDNVGAGTLHYTLDGSEPTAQSARYEEPFKLQNSSIVQAIRVVDGAVASKVYAVAYQGRQLRDGEIHPDWLIRYFGADYLTDDRAHADADPDQDGNNNLKEYTAGTDPLDPLSGFGVRIKSAPCIVFSSVPGQSYRILRRSSPAAENVEVAVVKALGTQTSYVDVTLTESSGFYTVEPVR